MESITLHIHIATVILLGLLIIVNIIMILRQKDDIKLKKYLRMQATGWVTVYAMVIFTGITMMAFAHIGLSIKIIAMIAAAIALLTLEFRRHIATKRARCNEECFVRFKRKVFTLYVFQISWILMVTVFAFLIKK